MTVPCPASLRFALHVFNSFSEVFAMPHWGGRSESCLPHFPILRVRLIGYRVGIKVLRAARSSMGKWQRRMVLAEVLGMARGFESREG